MSSPAPSQASDMVRQFPSLSEVLKQRNHDHRASSTSSTQRHSLPPVTEEHVQEWEDPPSPSSADKDISDLTLAQAVVVQPPKKQQLPILPRPRPRQPPASSPSSAPQQSRPSRQKKPTKRKTLQTEDGKRKIPLNKCPEAGSLAARLRTLPASLKRCNNDEKKIELLASHNMTWADYDRLRETMKREQEGKRKGRRVRVKAANMRTKEETPDDEHESREPTPWSVAEGEIDARECVPPPWDERDPPQTFAEAQLKQLLMHENLPGNMDENVLRRDAAHIHEYYNGERQHHRFFVIARFKSPHEHNPTKWTEHDYLVVTAMQCPVNGDSAIRCLLDILVSIRTNTAAVRSSLAAAVSREAWEFPYMDTILKTGLASVGPWPMKIFWGQQLDFNEKDLFGMPSFVIDVTEPANPRYCFLETGGDTYFQFGGHSIRAKDYYPRFLVIPLEQQRIHHQAIWSRRDTPRNGPILEEFGIVRPEALKACWPFLNIQGSSVSAFKDLEVDELPINEVLDGAWPCYPHFSYMPQLSREMLVDQVNKHYPQWANPYIPQARGLPPHAFDAIMEFSPRTTLTLSGYPGFKDPAVCQVLRDTSPHLIYLNLMGCDILPHGLRAIREIPTLDTFLHNTTLVPGLFDRLFDEEGNRKALKVAVFHLSGADGLADHEAWTKAEQFTRTQDERFISLFHSVRTGFEHPFMGPLSALNCLKVFDETIKREPVIIPALGNLEFYSRIFCRGFDTEIRVGLPVALTWEYDDTGRPASVPWVWNERTDESTRLIITCCRGKTFAYFYQWSNNGGCTPVMTRFTPSEFLMDYKTLFPSGFIELGDVFDRLEQWCRERHVVALSADEIQSGEILEDEALSAPTANVSDSDGGTISEMDED